MQDAELIGMREYASTSGVHECSFEYSNLFSRKFLHRLRFRSTSPAMRQVVTRNVGTRSGCDERICRKRRGKAAGGEGKPLLMVEGPQEVSPHLVVHREREEFGETIMLDYKASS